MYDMPKNARLNARLDDELAKKVDFLRRRTGSTTTAVIRRSIERYYDEERGTDEAGADALFATGFVGCAAGEAELSLRYKKALHEALGKKL